MSLSTAFLGLLAFTLFREIYFMRQIQKLLDKAMSRSHHEYQLAQRVGKAEEPKPEVDDDIQEDLGALQGIL